MENYAGKGEQSTGIDWAKVRKEAKGFLTHEPVGVACGLIGAAISPFALVGAAPIAAIIAGSVIFTTVTASFGGILELGEQLASRFKLPNRKPSRVAAKVDSIIEQMPARAPAPTPETAKGSAATQAAMRALRSQNFPVVSGNAATVAGIGAAVAFPAAIVPIAAGTGVAYVAGMVGREGVLVKGPDVQQNQQPTQSR